MTARRTEKFSLPIVDRRQAITTIASASIAATCSGNSANAASASGPGTATAPTSWLKARAAQDYRNSHSNWGGQLSDSISHLFSQTGSSKIPHFSVAIIGSGYGASICAARISERLRDDQRLCVLERGREWIPGTFPDTFRGLKQNSRVQPWGRNRGQTNNPLGLFQLSVGQDINLLSASALGGTSLINAGIALKPDPEVFRQSRWPKALRERSVLDPYFEIAAEQLHLSRTPAGQTAKVRTRQNAAYNISKRKGFFDRSPLAVMYDHRYLDEQMRNSVGVVQRPCTLCGDCITGCNVGAKNTLVTNYLPQAKMNGAELFTQVEVQKITPSDVGYLIDLDHHQDRNGSAAHTPYQITAEIVIVACGSPGSSQVLMQSQGDQFRFSPALGKNWSYNGDTIGFVMDGKFQSNMSGIGAHDERKTGPGPTVQTSMIFERRPDLKHRIVIQEAAVPRAVVGLFKLLLKDRQLDNSMVMLGMGMDDATGNIVWKEDRWQVSWPGLRESPFRKMMFKEFERAAIAHGGWYKRPKALGDRLVSVHPLGACGMSDDPSTGVVNHLGQVYDGQNGGCSDQSGQPETHPGLYVADGSIMPTALGVNPLMTISALSERIARHLTSHPRHAHLFDHRANAERQSG